MDSSTWVVVPCFNEAARLDDEAFAAVMGAPGSPTFLFVDDGSSDGTEALLHGLAGRFALCRVVSLARNAGKAEAVRAGLNTALDAGAVRVGYWDADLATPLSALPVFDRILDEEPGLDLVLGARVRLLGRRIERSAARHYLGRIYATIASLGLGLHVYDTQCGAKLFRASPALAGALARPFRSRWAFDVEVLARLQEAWGRDGAARLLEFPLQEWHDVGESKVSLAGGAGAFLFVFGLLLRRALGMRARGYAAPPSQQAEPVARAGSDH